MTAPRVDVAAERERVLARRANTFPQAEASEPRSESGWHVAGKPSRDERVEIAGTRETHVPGESQPNQEEVPVIKAAAGPKLTPEQRNQVKALVRRELLQDPAASASGVRKRVERELDISLNNATFHGTYWRKVKAEMEDEAPPRGTGDNAAPGMVGPPQNEAELSGPLLASPQEEISMAPGPDGQWRVQVQLLASRAQALRLMQAVVGVRGAEE